MSVSPFVFKRSTSSYGVRTYPRSKIYSLRNGVDLLSYHTIAEAIAGSKWEHLLAPEPQRQALLHLLICCHLEIASLSVYRRKGTLCIPSFSFPWAQDGPIRPRRNLLSTYRLRSYRVSTVSCCVTSWQISFLSVQCCRCV